MSHAHADADPSSKRDTEAERQRRHHSSILACFGNYERHEKRLIDRRRTGFHRLPEWQQSLLPDHLDLLDELDRAISINARFLQEVAAEARFLSDDISATDSSRNLGEESSQDDHDRLRSTIRQLQREWSSEGREERDACHRVILGKIEEIFGQSNAVDKSKIKILVPGAGLARLVWEIARAGYACQGSECSMFMLQMSNYILNNTNSIGQHIVYPNIHSLCNVKSSEDVLSGVKIPDVLPNSLAAGSGQMTMIAGDFVDVYARDSEKAQWDCVVTCFFIDTASNVIEYLTTIKHCLKPRGIWINLGPLLWHHEESQTCASLELSLEDLLGLCGRMGFRDEREIRAHYNSAPNSMLRHEYMCSFFCAMKM